MMDQSSMRITNTTHDVMDDYTGFLERRKLERGMQRNTEISQLDGMISSLKHDVERVLDSARRDQHKRKEGKEDLKAVADQKENLLTMEDFTDIGDTMIQDTSLMPGYNADETVLKKRSSNERQTQQRLSQRNIFNRERKSNLGDGGTFGNQGDARNSAKPNKENGAVDLGKARLSQRKSELESAAKIVARKMKQMQIAESMRGTEVQEAMEENENSDDSRGQER